MSAAWSAGTAVEAGVFSTRTACVSGFAEGASKVRATAAFEAAIPTAGGKTIRDAGPAAGPFTGRPPGAAVWSANSSAAVLVRWYPAAYMERMASELKTTRRFDIFLPELRVSRPKSSDIEGPVSARSAGSPASVNSAIPAKTIHSELWNAPIVPAAINAIPATIVAISK